MPKLRFQNRKPMGHVIVGHATVAWPLLLYSLWLQIPMRLVVERDILVCSGDLLWLSQTPGHLDALFKCSSIFKGLSFNSAAGNFPSTLQIVTEKSQLWRLYETLIFKVSASHVNILVVHPCMYSEPHMEKQMHLQFKHYFTVQPFNQSQKCSNNKFGSIWKATTWAAIIDHI